MKSLLLVLLSAVAANAATSVQTETLSFTKTFSGTATESIPMLSTFTMAVDPFDPSLGTLDSFTISWAPFGSYSSTVISSSPGGNTNANLGGVVYLNNTAFNGIGGAGNGSASTNGLITGTLAFPSGPIVTTVQAATPGSTTNQALLALVTGSGPLALRWDTPLGLGYGYVTDGTVTVGVVGTMTYNYTAVPEPSAMVLGAVGMLACLRRRR